jgi:hypothetical protein
MSIMHPLLRAALAGVATASRIAIALATLLACHAAPGAAAGTDPDPPMFVFNAFGSLGVVHSSDSQADFTSSNTKPDGAGYGHSWSANVDSRFGAQLTANVSSQLSAVVQLISEQDYSNSYRPEVEWANIKYQFTPEFDIRIGRIDLPLFLVSDARKVGFANPWVRPPVEVYGITPISNSDGLDLSYRLHLGDTTTTLAASYARSYRIDLPLHFSSESRDVSALIVKTEYGAALFNLSYLTSHATLYPTIGLFSAYRELGAPGNAIVDTFGLVDKLSTIFSAGVSYDPGQWFATAEWTQFDNRSFIGDNRGWYVSGGYRIANLTPYLTYSVLTVSPTSSAGVDAAALPAYLAGTAAALNAGLNQILRQRPAQRTDAAGVRWDFARNLDLKIQIDHTQLGPGSPGKLFNLQPGFRFGGTVNIFSAAIDFVF